MVHLHPYDEPVTARRRSLLTGVVLYLLLAVTAMCYLPALDGPFVFDDFPNLQNLREVDGSVTRETIGRYLYSFTGNPGRPLAALSFLIEDAAWPADPRDFKRDNLLFHLLVGLLVFALTRRLARTVASGEEADAVALACTAMWLLQPMQLSATMMIVQRMNILAALFVLLGLLGYVRILYSERTRPLLRVLAMGLATGTAAATAILCKENGVLIFAFALALNLTLLRRRVGEYPRASRALLNWGLAAPLLVLVAVPLASPDVVLGPYRWRDFTLGERLLSQPRILFEYLWAIVVPRLGGQGVFHDDYTVSRSLLEPPSTMFAIAAWGVLLGSALRYRARFPVLAFAVLWFVAGHLLESTVVGLELYYEHRNYLPMVGPLFALAYGLLRLGASRRSLGIAAVLAWVALAAVLTFQNAGIWGDRGRLALTWLAENPGSMRAVQMAASYYTDEGRLVDAARILEDGSARLPGRTELRFQRLLLACVDRGVDPADWRELLGTNHAADSSRAILGVVHKLRENVELSGCHGSLSAADLRALIASLMGKSRYADNSHSASTLHYELAQIALADRDLNALIENLERSYDYRPDPLTAREAAIHLLNAGLPGPALEFIELSDSTPMPWFKRRLLGIEVLNAPLRKVALERAAPSDGAVESE